MNGIHDLLGLVAALGGLGTAAFHGVAFIREGERGIKLRFGKAVRGKNGVKVYEPGFHFMIPWVHSLPRRHVRQTPVQSEDQEVMLKDQTVFLVATVVIFRVTNVYHAMFEVTNLEKSVHNFCMAMLRKVLSEKTIDEVTDTQALSKALLEAVRARAEEWGVEFDSFQLTNFSPSPQTVELILTKKLAEARLQALIDCSTKLDCKPTDIDPGVAAAIIGIPVTTSISPLQRVAKTN